MGTVQTYMLHVQLHIHPDLEQLSLGHTNTSSVRGLKQQHVTQKSNRLATMYLCRHTTTIIVGSLTFLRSPLK